MYQSKNVYQKYVR